MPKADRYTVEHAARRAGVSTSRIRQLIRAGELQVVSQRPIQVEASGVERLRAEHLESFEDVLDMSTPPISPGDEWLRTVAAAQESLDGGIEKVRQAARMLIDGYIAGLPVPYDAPSDRSGSDEQGRPQTR